MKLTNSLLLLSFLSTATSQAAFTLVNDFDSGIGSWDNSSAQNSNISNPLTTATFGSGSNYVDLSDASTGGFGYEASGNAGFNALGTSGTLAFEYLAPNEDWFFSIGQSAFSSNRAFTLTPTDLFTTLNLSTDTAYQVSFLYNISGGSLTYDDPRTAGSSDGTLANDTGTVFFQERGSSTIVKSDDLARNGTVSLEGLWFTKTGSGTSSTQLDNLQQSTSLEVLVIPEPSTALLGALGALALLRRRR